MQKEKKKRVLLYSKLKLTVFIQEEENPQAPLPPLLPGLVSTTLGRTNAEVTSATAEATAKGCHRQEGEKNTTPNISFHPTTQNC
ncbi:hypothetical protein JTE90_019251 [Oedothorax gibbosus]|uniref:Uncharacterized protein n=1 Tax=Oedothorax gibbosus TaxID=931172 RepID=A0AAV6URT4_9ARAC|nr:hypothetical protein JTE90_019251 [Oedothorax gibbosus]